MTQNKTTTKAPKNDEDDDEMDKRRKAASEDEDEETSNIKKGSDETDEDEDLNAKKKKKMKAKTDDEDEDTMEKDESGGDGPVEDSGNNNKAGNTMTPNYGVPGSQDVFVQPSGVNVGRDASGVSGNSLSPSDQSYMGKSANTDLLKSPVFVELNKSINSLSEALSKKLTSVEKSINDRVNNMQKLVEQVEKFYKNQPLNKAISEQSQGFAPIKKSADDKMRDTAQYSY